MAHSETRYRIAIRIDPRSKKEIPKSQAESILCSLCNEDGEGFEQRVLDNATDFLLGGHWVIINHAEDLRYAVLERLKGYGIQWAGMSREEEPVTVVDSKDEERLGLPA